MTHKHHARGPRLGLCACAALVALLIAATAAGAAETRTVGLTAQVNYAQSFNISVCGDAAVGDIITGSYTYTLGTRDTSPGNNSGSYGWSAPPNGITLNVGSAVVQTDYNAPPPPRPGPPGPPFTIGLTIGNSPTPADSYTVESSGNQGCFFNRGMVSLTLVDTTGTALTNTSLPTKAPKLADWDLVGNDPCTGNGLRLFGEDPFRGSWQICAAVTSLTTIK
jgi:hypothetical protein